MRMHWMVVAFGGLLTVALLSHAGAGGPARKADVEKRLDRVEQRLDEGRYRMAEIEATQVEILENLRQMRSVVEADGHLLTELMQDRMLRGNKQTEVATQGSEAVGR